MKRNPVLLIVIGTLGLWAMLGASARATMTFTDRATFLSQLTTSITDDYSAPGYAAGDLHHDATLDIHSNAHMSAVLGETDYETTGFDNLNIIVQSADPTYCAGCNGSFRLTFTTTSVGGPSGVFGAGADFFNQGSPSYVAFVTFGDLSTEEFPLPLGSGFAGITSPLLIRSVHFGLSGGAPTMGGSFSIDNLTIGSGFSTPCQNQNQPEVCNGLDDNCNGLVDEGFPDSDGDGIADCVDRDVDGDGVLNGADNCPTVFNPDQRDTNGNGIGDACDTVHNPTVNPPSGTDITVDGQFEPGPGEWADVTPISFLNGQAKVYTSLDPGRDAIYLMYDFSLSTNALAVNDEVGPVAFKIGNNSFFDVFLIQGGPNTNFGPHPTMSEGGMGDRVRVLLNGQPFDNSAGCVRGAVDFNSTSPNFPGLAHNVAELEVHLTGSPGGCYSPEPAFWSATLPGVRPTGPGAATRAGAGMNEIFIVSQSFVNIDSNTGTTAVTPLIEGPFGDPTCSDGIDNDGDGLVDGQDPDCQLDHFLCYKTATVMPTFTPVTAVNLVDQFGQRNVTVSKPASLCNPVDKNGEEAGAENHTEHEQGFAIKGPTFLKKTNITVTNQFGSIQVDAVKPDRLLVPVNKSLLNQPPAPQPPTAGHYECYKVAASKGQTKFQPVPRVQLVDQFGGLTVDVVKPSRLCNPADKNQEEPGAERRPDHLMCYKIKSTAGTPKFARKDGVFATSQFGREQLSAAVPEELCVPSSKRLP